MPDRIALSIILCTRNRADSLRDTLAALAAVRVPPQRPTELVIVDNASTDHTPDVAGRAVLPGVDVRVVREARPGHARARNTALAAARGDVLLFTDDDVRPPPEWLEEMSRPIVEGAADAVAGGVRLAPHLERPWMERVHRTWLAETVFLDPRQPQEMVGANMAFGRHVLAVVPAFDPELGLGAFGQGEDSLFSWQLVRAGFRLRGALEVAVEHHIDPRRLLRASFGEAAVRRGRVLAYQRHHWEHLSVPHPWRRRLRASLALALRRAREPQAQHLVEGMPAWEMLALEHLAFLRQWRIEQRRPPNYDRFGLRRTR
jgi:glycosyltransferase involved in cell wall biosynthesis